MKGTRGWMDAVGAEPEAERVSRRRLWFGLWGGGVAWLAHLLLAYGIAEFGCTSGFKEWHFLGITTIAWLLLLISLVTLGGALLPAWLAYRAEQALRQAGNEDAEEQPGLFLARAGWVTSGLFMLVIVVESIPIFFYLRGC